MSLFFTFLWPKFMFSGNWINYLKTAKANRSPDTAPNTPSQCDTYRVSDAARSCLCFRKAICRASHLHHEIGEQRTLLADKMKYHRIWQLQYLLHPACYMNSVPMSLSTPQADEDAKWQRGRGPTSTWIILINIADILLSHHCSSGGMQGKMPQKKKKCWPLQNRKESNLGNRRGCLFGGVGPEFSKRGGECRKEKEERERLSHLGWVIQHTSALHSEPYLQYNGLSLPVFPFSR